MKILEMLFAAELRPTPAPELVRLLQEKLQIHDEMYLDVIKVANGGLFGGQNYLYAVEDIEERNTTFEAEHHIPDHCLIGDDSGGIAFAIQKELTQSPVWLVHHGEMRIHESYKFDNLYEFLRFANGLSRSPDKPESFPDKVDVMLMKQPAGGLKELLKIKECLGLQASVGELRRGVGTLPLLLLSEVPFGKYQVRCERYNAVDSCLALTEVDNAERVVWP